MRQLRGLAFLMLAAAMLALPPAHGDSAAAGQRALVLEIDGVIASSARRSPTTSGASFAPRAWTKSASSFCA